MTTWLHERLFRRPSREDSRCPVGRGISKSQAARTFGVSLSSVKRYVKKAHHGESLAPKKSPGSAPKLDERAIKLLEEDLEERPFATLRDRCDYMEVVTGLFVSRSTMCRAIARIGTTRKKGDGTQRSATSSEEPPGG